ncbi:Zn-ribbon domain-containing OB-fold protein [Streptomyces chartreusis]|uniref:Zn-ribbon domain-containing OB-fold protein n=1 Tax=Streptomyces chartreusis TaxID=1969 RepID=UPI003677EFBA
MHKPTKDTRQPTSGIAAGLAESDEAETTTTLFFQRCTWCGTVSYHRLLCPACQSTELSTEPSQGTGTVRHSRAILRNTPSARNVSLVEMAEGFVVRGRVMGVSVGIPAGARVQLFTTKDSVRQEPLFTLLDTADAMEQSCRW